MFIGGDNVSVTAKRSDLYGMCGIITGVEYGGKVKK